MSHQSHIVISRSPRLEPGHWYAQTVHDRKTKETTVYLFERSKAKRKVGTQISDFFRGIRPAADQANTHLRRLFPKDEDITKLLSPIKIDKQPDRKSNDTATVQRDLTSISSSHLMSMEPEESGKSSNSKTVSDAQSGIIIEDSERERKQEWSDLICPSTKNTPLPDISESTRKLISAIHYAIDLEQGVARPKPKSELQAMATYLSPLLFVDVPSISEAKLSELNALYECLQKGHGAPKTDDSPRSRIHATSTSLGKKTLHKTSSINTHEQTHQKKTATTRGDLDEKQKHPTRTLPIPRKDHLEPLERRYSASDHDPDDSRQPLTGRSTASGDDSDDEYKLTASYSPDSAGESGISES